MTSYVSGTLINVWWPAENNWFAGYADNYDINRGLFVKYLDGDKRFHDLTVTRYEILSEADAQKAITKKRKFTGDEINTIRSTVECSICFDVFTKPLSLPCTHTFCEDCLKQSFKTSKDCPLCKETFLFREARHNPSLDKICKLFAPETTSSQAISSQAYTSSQAIASQPMLSANPLHALAQITGAGTFKCHSCGGRKVARSHKCTNPCPMYM